MDSGQRDLNSEHTTPDRQTSKQVGTKRNARERERERSNQKQNVVCACIGNIFMLRASPLLQFFFFFFTLGHGLFIILL